MPLTPWLSHYKTDFELARRRRGESIQFDGLRCEAFDRFLLVGFPAPGDDSWRSVDVAPIADTCFTMGSKPADAARAAGSDLSLHDACAELVFANGYLLAERSTGALPNGAVAAPLASILASNPDALGAYFARVARVDRLPLVALNTALFEDGAAILVPPHTTIDAPIHVRFVSTGEADAKPAMSQPRVLIVLGEASRANVVENYAGPDGIDYFTNAVTEVVLGNGAALEHDVLQDESTTASLVTSAHVIAGADASYTSNGIDLGGAFARNETIVTLGGRGAVCTVNRFRMAAGDRLVNSYTVIDHAAADCMSRQRDWSVLVDRARGVLGGQRIVPAESRNARARHVTRVLMSRGASVEATDGVAIEHLPDDDPGRRVAAIARFGRRAFNRVRTASLRARIGQLFERHLERLQ
jgi:Fe-S cluster assembly protein SufD